MSTIDVYPSLDGFAGQYSNDQTWDTIHNGAGNGHDDTGLTAQINLTSGGLTGWNTISRCILCWDLSSVTGIVNNATITLVGDAKKKQNAELQANIYGATPTSTSDLANGDYTQCGTNAFSTGISYTNWNTSGNNVFLFNPTGITAIQSKTGDIFSCSVRDETYDASDTEAPTLVGNKEDYIDFWTVDKGTTYRPKLEISYEPAASITVIDTISFAENSTNLRSMIVNLIDTIGFSENLTNARGVILSFIETITFAEELITRSFTASFIKPIISGVSAVKPKISSVVGIIKPKIQSVIRSIKPKIK